MTYEYNVREKWCRTTEDERKNALQQSVQAEAAGRLGLLKCDGDGVMDLFLLDVKR